MSRAPIAVLHEGLDAHPALLAWEGFQSVQETPARIEVLRQHGVTGVYRLVGVGPAGNVIAKRTPAAKAQVERTVYEGVLPHAAVTSPRYYGARPVDDGAAAFWMFLEDVGADRYSDQSAAHMTLTARWIAQLHGAVTGVAAARTLPDGGPGRYQAHLAGAREKIERRLPGPDLTNDDVAMLEGVVDRLNRVDAHWSHIESCCVGLPPTVVHGDFRPKNVYLRTNGCGVACYPIDWETAGWGVPAADLTRVDLHAYWSVAREWCEGVTFEDVRRLAWLGQVFRTLAAIDWETASLRFETRRMISRPLAGLAVLTPRLTDAVQMTGVPA